MAVPSFANAWILAELYHRQGRERKREEQKEQSSFSLLRGKSVGR